MFYYDEVMDIKTPADKILTLFKTTHLPDGQIIGFTSLRWQ